jgi:hypothetical protein
VDDAARLGESWPLLEHHARSAMRCLEQSSQFAGTPIQYPLDLQVDLYCGDCTEVGAPEVDGLLIGSRFGGQSGSRTNHRPVLLLRVIRREFRPSLRSSSVHSANLTLNADERNCAFSRA